MAEYVTAFDPFTMGSDAFHFEVVQRLAIGFARLSKGPGHMSPSDGNRPVM